MLLLEYQKETNVHSSSKDCNTKKYKVYKASGLFLVGQIIHLEIAKISSTKSSFLVSSLKTRPNLAFLCVRNYKKVNDTNYIFKGTHKKELEKQI